MFGAPCFPILQNPLRQSARLWRWSNVQGAATRSQSARLSPHPSYDHRDFYGIDTAVLHSLHFARDYFCRWGMWGRIARIGDGSVWKGAERVSQQRELGRRIRGTRTAHPYRPSVSRHLRAGREPLCRVPGFGSVTTQALKKVRRP